MVKVIFPNSTPAGQESPKCLENSATGLVLPRKLELSSRRGHSQTSALEWPRREKKSLMSVQLSCRCHSKAEVYFGRTLTNSQVSALMWNFGDFKLDGIFNTKAVALYLTRFGLPWPAGVEFGKMTFIIVFVYAK